MSAPANQLVKVNFSPPTSLKSRFYPMKTLIKLFLSLLFGIAFTLNSNTTLASSQSTTPQAHLSPKALKVGAAPQSIQIANYSYIFSEKQYLTADEALLEFINGKFEFSHGHLAKGFTKRPHWLAFDLLLTTQENQELILSFPHLHPEKIELYLFSNHILLDKKTLGIFSKADDQFYPNRLENIKTTFPGNTKTTVLVRFEGPYQDLNMGVYSEQNFFKNETRNSFLFGAYYGVMLVMLLYNLFLFLSIRDKTYILYVLFISSYIWFQLNMDGYIHYWIPTEIKFLYDRLLSSSQIITQILGLIYTQSFLGSKNTPQPINKTITITIKTYILLLFVGLTTLRGGDGILLYAVTSIFTSTLILAAAYTSWRIKNFTPAKYLFWGWVSLAVGTSLLSLSAVLGTEKFEYFKYFQQIGSAIEVVLLSFALASRIKSLREENHSATNKISSLKISEEKAINEKNQVQRTNREKSRFLSSMSHELRTPLNIILGYSQLLEKDPSIKKSHKKNIQEIKKSGYLLLKLVNEVLDLSKIESGKIKISTRPVKAITILKDSLSLFEIAIEEKSIQLSTFYNNTHDIHILVDPFRLKQVLLNLLSNAIKYNKESGDIFVTTSKTLQNTLKISIRDTGRGIPKDKWAEVFEEFNRIDMENSKIEGTGIGMPIAKRLTELMKGHIDFRSEPGKGSEFWVTFPICESSSEIHKSIQDIENSCKLHLDTSKRLLYIEDQVENIRLLEKILSGYRQIELDVEADGLLGVYKARTNKYDLIILDIDLPNIDGYQALEILTSDPLTQYTPVIALTAIAHKDIEEGSAAMGFDAYLTKPIQLNIFIPTLNRLLQKSSV
ncbi:MAG: response regulator [Agarilytica sp.]